MKSRVFARITITFNKLRNPLLFGIINFKRAFEIAPVIPGDRFGPYHMVHIEWAMSYGPMVQDQMAQIVQDQMSHINNVIWTRGFGSMDQIMVKGYIIRRRNLRKLKENQNLISLYI